jgi:DNA-binding SARP family transcriptional activator
VVAVASVADKWFVQLLGGFELRGPDGVVEAPPGAQRLLAFVALQGGSVSRSRAARELWPDLAAQQAAASLRSTLWRIRQLGRLVDPGATTLRLAAGVEVDVQGLLGTGPVGGLDAVALGSAANLELLPDWGEDWVTVERERMRHLELQVLDDRVASLVGSGRVVEALDTALRAIRLEPLRESSHRAIITIFLQTGNRSAALAHYHDLVELLRDELGLGPGADTTALVQPFLSSRVRGSRKERPGHGPRQRRAGVRPGR